MAGKANPTIVADRYALALLELAIESKKEDQVNKDLKALVDIVSGNAMLSNVLNSPLLNKEEGMNVLKEILSKLKACDLSHKFIYRLIDNKRLGLMALIVHNYHRMLAKYRGEVRVYVTVARKLDDKKQAELVNSLKKAIGAKLETEIHEDPSLMGGMIVKIGSKMLDASAKSRLERMRFAMKGA